MRQVKWTIAVILTILSAAGIVYAAQPYSATIECVPLNISSSYYMQYLITNTSLDDNYVIWIIQIEVDADTNLLTTSAIDNWKPDLTEPHFVTWTTKNDYIFKSIDPSTFGIEFDRQPEYQNWSAVFRNINNPEETPVDFGCVNVTPEPATAASMIFLIASTITLIKRKTR